MEALQSFLPCIYELASIGILHSSPKDTSDGCINILTSCTSCIYLARNWPIYLSIFDTFNSDSSSKSWLYEQSPHLTSFYPFLATLTYRSDQTGLRVKLIVDLIAIVILTKDASIDRSKLAFGVDAGVFARSDVVVLYHQLMSPSLM